MLRKMMAIGAFLSLSFIVGLFGIAQFAYGAPVQQAGDAGGELEPNDTFGSASPITTGIVVEESIFPRSDVDWYRLTLDHQGELQVSITDVDPDLDINVRVWNANKDTVSAWFAPLAEGGDTVASVDLAEPGRYYLEVADANSDAESAQPYTLQTEFTATADSDEPNSWFGAASLIAFDQPVQANILPTGDVDWYRVAVDHHGELRVQISDVASDLAVSVRAWNSNKDTISGWIAPLAEGGNTSAVIDLPAAGAYYLEVAGNSNQRSIEPYTIEAAFTPAADADEPNNNFGSATRLPFETTQPANILPQGDVDWYSVDVEQHGELGVVISGVSETLDIDFRVWNNNKDTISGWIAPLAEGGDTIGTVDLPTPGRYYLEVADGGSDARAIQPFWVTAIFTRAVDPFEPNNSFGTASNLGIDQEVQTNILPQGDSDWHAVDVGHQGELQVMASDVPANLDIDIRVWNANKDTISGWIAPLARGGDTTGSTDLPTAGRYYLEVADGGSDARSVQPFTLQAKFIAAADKGEPNDTAETATPVNLDTTIPANILPANDADWCRLEITQTGELHVLITNVAPDLELAMRLWDESEQVVSDWVYPLAAGGDTVAVFPIAEPGVYFLEVVDNRGSRSIQPYLLRFSMEEIDPASVVFTQTLTNTQTLTDTVVGTADGAETITTTTTTIITIITNTLTASGTTTVTESITTTQVMTSTSVLTETDEAPATDVVTPTITLTVTEIISPGVDTSAPAPETVITATGEITATDELTATETPTVTEGLSPTADSPTGLAAAPISGDAVVVEGVTLTLPSGWRQAEPGGPFHGLALEADDLTATAPAGPRIWVLAPEQSELELTVGVGEVGSDTLEVFEEANTIVIGDWEAVAIGMQETIDGQTVNRRYVYINTADGQAYQLILEAPVDQWEEQLPTLEGILASVQLAPSE